MFSKALLALALFGALAVAINAQTIQSCSEAGVTNSDQCNAQCSGNCFCSFTEMMGTTSCGCSNGFSCTSVSFGGDDDFFNNLNDEVFGNDEISFGDDDFFNNFVGGNMVDLLRNMYIGFFGQQCAGPINRAINSDLANCIQESLMGDDDDDSYFDIYSATGEALDEICTNKCLNVQIRAVRIMADADCLTPQSVGNDDMFSMDDYTVSSLTDLSSIEDMERTLAVMCARGNGIRCGNIFPTLAALEETNSSPTQAQCQTLVSAGNCLGTFAAHIDQFTDDDMDDDFDVDAFATMLDTACTAEGVTGIAEAAAGTVAPATLGSSSASTAVASVFAAFAMVAAAALF